MVPPLIHSALHSAGENKAVWNSPRAVATVARAVRFDLWDPRVSCEVQTRSSKVYVVDASRTSSNPSWSRAKEGTGLSMAPLSTTRVPVRAENICSR